MVKLALFRLLLWMLPRVPRRFGLRLFAALGSVAAVIAPSRRAVRENMRHVVGPTAGHDLIERLTRQVFANQARNYFDMFYFANRPLSDVAAVTDVSALRDAIRELSGKGAVAVTMHYGNLDVVGQSAGACATNALAVVEHLRPEALFRLVTAIRARTGLEVVPAELAPLAAMRAVRSGRIVVLAADRDITGTGIVTRFFGSPARVPDGYARLAITTRAPILLLHSHRLPDDRFQLHAALMSAPPQSGDRDTAVRGIVDAVLEALEPVLAADPSQWVLFLRLWLGP